MKIKQTMIFLGLGLAAGMILCGSLSADPAKDVAGKYGFDWFNPQKAKCTLISTELAARLKSCAPGVEGSFTGKKDYLACTLNKKGDYLIYPTKARCQEELETMQANGE